jgi:hypothetical protein
MQTIMIIRHAEKPVPDGADGVTAACSLDPESLVPPGWQRAGAWMELFAPSLGQPSVLPTPATIFASAPKHYVELAAGHGGSKSLRPLETISYLAAKLGLQVNLSFAKGNETGLAAALALIEGVVLVCWQHENIIAIANALTDGMQGIPAKWHDSRFNVVFKFDRADEALPWAFTQIVPLMMPGDIAAPL